MRHAASQAPQSAFDCPCTPHERAAEVGKRRSWGQTRFNSRRWSLIHAPTPFPAPSQSVATFPALLRGIKPAVLGGTWPPSSPIYNILVRQHPARPKTTLTTSDFHNEVCTFRHGTPGAREQHHGLEQLRQLLRRRQLLDQQGYRSQHLQPRLLERSGPRLGAHPQHGPRQRPAQRVLPRQDQGRWQLLVPERLVLVHCYRLLPDAQPG